MLNVIYFKLSNGQLFDYNVFQFLSILHSGKDKLDDIHLTTIYTNLGDQGQTNSTQLNST